MSNGNNQEYQQRFREQEQMKHGVRKKRSKKSRLVMMFTADELDNEIKNYFSGATNGK